MEQENKSENIGTVIAHLFLYNCWQQRCEQREFRLRSTVALLLRHREITIWSTIFSIFAHGTCVSCQSVSASAHHSKEETITAQQRRSSCTVVVITAPSKLTQRARKFF
jgi:hypothetical protein